MRWMIWVVAVGMVVGCNRDSGDAKTGASTSQKSGGVIGVSVLTMTNPFFKEIVDTMTDEAKRNGMEVVAVSGEFDPARQYGQVKEFIVSAEAKYGPNADHTEMARLCELLAGSELGSGEG